MPDVFPPIPLKKNDQGLFPIPDMRCGVLPWYPDQSGDIIWGCVESNRTGPVTIAPPAGTQDIILLKDGHSWSLEVKKPLPALICDCLEGYGGKLFRDDVYQEVLTWLVEHHFEPCIEHPLATALHETQEEHGIDLHAKGHDHHLLRDITELPIQQLSGQRGATSHATWLACLHSPEGVVLTRTHKTDGKIRRNLNRQFTESGCWGTLASFHALFASERARFSPGAPVYTELEPPPNRSLVEDTFAEFQEALTTLAELEKGIRTALTPTAPQASSPACSSSVSALGTLSFFGEDTSKMSHFDYKSPSP